MQKTGQISIPAANGNIYVRVLSKDSLISDRGFVPRPWRFCEAQGGGGMRARGNSQEAGMTLAKLSQARGGAEKSRSRVCPRAECQ